MYSFQVSRDAKTGLSRGCGYITMSSRQEAKAVINALDGSVSRKILSFYHVIFSYRLCLSSGRTLVGEKCVSNCRLMLLSEGRRSMP